MAFIYSEKESILLDIFFAPTVMSVDVGQGLEGKKEKF